jgi:general stress protein CsbA
MRVLEAALVVYVVLALTLPYLLSGDRTMLTFATYITLATISIATAASYLRRWAEVE